MVAFRATSPFLFLALAACSVGEVPIGGGGQPDARAPVVDAAGTPIDGTGATIDASGGGGNDSATYTMKIVPLVSRDTANGKACNSANCHVAGGLPPDFSSFTTFAAKYRTKPGDMAKVIIKGAHSGPALTAADKQTFIDWINTTSP